MTEYSFVIFGLVLCFNAVVFGLKIRRFMQEATKRKGRDYHKEWDLMIIKLQLESIVSKSLLEQQHLSESQIKEVLSLKEKWFRIKDS